MAMMPVRYDPDDRSRIEVDGPALNARTEAALAEASQRKIQDAEAELARKRRDPA